ncbi:hypothetical protein IEQ34_019175 [Dendrobium chrysotoxum]|uniref:Serine hydrolase domain-containing protein n=1 Tax=Dendrobium chrysotoxum TaxID=161865 RepID=A0AAV7G649_DENCH|nr:hypothetical protein IEQ34_019175 [Dendrobium chrysotoxum]
MGSLTVPAEPTNAILGASEYHRRRPRFLCLHGFRTSAEIMRKQVLGKWPDRVTARLDLFFADAPFPAEGKSEVEGIFDPPYYEWFQFNKVAVSLIVDLSFDSGFTEFRNFDECLAYIEDLMIKHGPFDGLMGFSQGAALSAALPGLQAKGLALKNVPQVKNVVIIGGGKIPVPVVVEKAFDVKIKCPSLHFIGDLDFLKEPGEALLDAFVEPFVVRHSRGHTVPRLDDKSLETVLGYIDRIEKNMDEETELSLSKCEESIEAAPC